MPTADKEPTYGFHVDPKTLRFYNIGPHEAAELEFVVNRILIDGKAEMQHSSFQEWCKVAEYEERQAFLTHTTAFPQMVLLSLVEYWKKRATAPAT